MPPWPLEEPAAPQGPGYWYLESLRSDAAQEREASEARIRAEGSCRAMGRWIAS